MHSRWSRFIRQSLTSLYKGWAVKLTRRSEKIAPLLAAYMKVIAVIWLSAMAITAGFKLMNAATPVRTILHAAEILLPYSLVALAPIAGYLIGKHSFPQGSATPQPVTRLSLYGRWRRVRNADAQRNPLFGPAGFMASLLIGMVLNVVVRTGEYMAAVPAMHSAAPAWGQALFLAMTADLVIMNFFYMACFAMALRTVPLFPRMLLFAWIMDISLQLAIAQFISATPPPPQVASALESLLTGNLHKVLISAAVWLPYLILSTRVNVTYRSRVHASD